MTGHDEFFAELQWADMEALTCLFRALVLWAERLDARDGQALAHAEPRGAAHGVDVRVQVVGEFIKRLERADLAASAQQVTATAHEPWSRVQESELARKIAVHASQLPAAAALNFLVALSTEWIRRCDVESIRRFAVRQDYTLATTADAREHRKLIVAWFRRLYDDYQTIMAYRDLRDREP